MVFLNGNDQNIIITDLSIASPACENNRYFSVVEYLLLKEITFFIYFFSLFFSDFKQKRAKYYNFFLSLELHLPMFILLEVIVTFQFLLLTQKVRFVDVLSYRHLNKKQKPLVLSFEFLTLKNFEIFSILQ